MNTNLQKQMQFHPYHVVDPSPWPLTTSIALFVLTTVVVLNMHGFENASYLLFLALFNLVFSMSLWFRDIIAEGTYYKAISLLYHILKVARAISNEVIAQILSVLEINNFNLTDKQLGYYLAGLLEERGILQFLEMELQL